MPDEKVICPLMSSMVAVPEEVNVPSGPNGLMNKVTQIKPMVLKCECARGKCGFWNYDVKACGQSGNWFSSKDVKEREQQA